MKRNYFYTFVGMILIAFYAFADFHGLELPSTTKSVAPQGLRGARGGSRSFWYSGFHGGK